MADVCLRCWLIRDSYSHVMMYVTMIVFWYDSYVMIVLSRVQFNYVQYVFYDV